MTKPCARCKGQGAEGDNYEQDCQMCDGSGEAVPCEAYLFYWVMPSNNPPALCGRPSRAWDGSEPVCHRHDPEVRLAVRQRVARARERVGA